MAKLPTDQKIAETQTAHLERVLAESHNFEERDPLEYITTHRSLLDLILLAIIDGNPTQKKTLSATAINKQREKRLDQARRILLGAKGSKGNSVVQDLSALIWMAGEFETAIREQIKSGSITKTKVNYKAVQIAPIAERAAIRFFSGDPNAKSRLEKKFRKNPKGYLGTRYALDETDMVVLEAATDVCSLLKLTGINIVAPTNIWD